MGKVKPVKFLIKKIMIFELNILELGKSTFKFNKEK